MSMLCLKHFNYSILFYCMQHPEKNNMFFSASHLLPQLCRTPNYQQPPPAPPKKKDTGDKPKQSQASIHNSKGRSWDCGTSGKACSIMNIKASNLLIVLQDYVSSLLACSLGMNFDFWYIAKTSGSNVTAVVPASVFTKRCPHQQSLPASPALKSNGAFREGALMRGRCEKTRCLHNWLKPSFKHRRSGRT